MNLSRIMLVLLMVGRCFVYAQNNEKHDIMVSSAAIQLLYRNCGNFLNINVPDLCSDYFPSCTATDADIQQSSEYKRKFLIVPRGNKTVISVFNNITETPEALGSIMFQVIEPPIPAIKILVNGQRASASTQVAKGSRISLKIVPDPEFAAAMPQDAQYRIEKVSIFKQFGLNAPIMVSEVALTNHNPVEGIDFPVPGEVFDGPSGTKIFVELGEISRINFKGQKLPIVRLNHYERSLSFLTK